MSKVENRQVGVIGVGTMGAAMVRRLLGAGYEVLVWNRSPATVAELVAQGARAVASPAEAFESGLAFSMLSDDAAVNSVFDAATLAQILTDSVHICMSTIEPATIEAQAASHAEAGVGLIAAPVLGRWPVAEAGQLSILASGPQAQLDQVQDLFDTLGRRTWIFGTSAEAIANANRVKAAMNYLIIHALAALGESTALLDAEHIDPELFVELCSDSLFPGPVYTGYGKMIAQRNYYPAGFTAQLGMKDLSLAISAAKRTGVTLPTSTILHDLFEKVIADGMADADWSAIAEVARSSVEKQVSTE